MEQKFEYIDCPSCGKKVAGWGHVCMECGQPLDGKDRLSDLNVGVKAKSRIVKHWEKGVSANRYSIMSFQYDVTNTELIIDAWVYKEKQHKDCREGAKECLYIHLYDPFNEHIAGERVWIDYIPVGEQAKVTIKSKIAYRGKYAIEIVVE